MKQNIKDLKRFKDIRVELTLAGRRYLDRNQRRLATYESTRHDKVRSRVVPQLMQAFEAKVIGTVS